MDQVEYLWFRYLDHKLDLILASQQGDQDKIKRLTANVEAKAAELQKAVDANKPK